MEKMDVSSKVAKILCELCNITCTDQQVYDQHVGGSKHQKKVKRQELEALWEARDPTVYCIVCELALEPSLMEDHVGGTKHKAMVEKRPEAEKERLTKLKGKKKRKSKAKPKPVAKKMVEVKKSAAPVKEITCTLCSVTINNLGVADTHFNSKSHAIKCAKKYIEEKNIKQESKFHCDTCNMTSSGQESFDLHLQGFKHNYKLMKGKFDPKSPFAEKTKKMKEKLEKMKEMQKEKKLQMRLSKEQENQE